jgi:hypothetical protein
VDNGEDYMRSHPGTKVPMPSGTAIFETVGPWEDYATPSRDMRLLIAMKVLEGLPERIRNYPELYVLRSESPSAAATRIERLHARRIQDSFVSYKRSDGGTARLSVADLYARRAGLEVAYNPNDCVERRWGASPGTPDYASCRRQALLPRGATLLPNSTGTAPGLIWSPDPQALAFPLQPGQCGMVLSGDGKVVCMDAVSRPDVFATLHGPLLTGYMLDAMHALDGTPAPGDAVGAFLTAAASAGRRPSAAAGLGTDVRLTAESVVGSALEFDGETIQLTAFRREPEELPGTVGAPARRIARPSRRRV